MTDPRDDLDAWLRAQVHPLPPPPGTFELIRRRARRRKLTRAVVAAAGAATVVAIIAAVPTLLIPRLQLGPGPTQSGAQAGQTQDASPTQPSASPSTPTPAPTTPAGLPTVPGNFAATSVTFIGTRTGWVLGPAGIPGQCPVVPKDCTSVARTDDGGATWYGVPAPVTSAPDGPAGVSQIRFLNPNDGWAFGPQLYATHDGGHNWTKISTGGLRVTALEARGDHVFAVWARCTGTGSGFAAHCTSFTVYSAAAGGDQWNPVAGATAGVSPGGTAGTTGRSGSTGSASLLLSGTRGYLLTPGGNLISGPVSGQGAWQPLVTAPAGAACTAGAAQPDGQPAGEMLATTGPSGLVLVCTGPASASSQRKTIYTSTDNGTTWQRGGTAPLAGTATSVAGTSSSIILATNLGIEVSADGGATWAAAGGTLPAGGFAFVGMTTPSQGVAVPADPGQHAVWFTMNGGRTWQASPIK